MSDLNTNEHHINEFLPDLGWSECYKEENYNFQNLSASNRREHHFYKQINLSPDSALVSTFMWLSLEQALVHQTQQNVMCQVAWKDEGDGRRMKAFGVILLAPWRARNNTSRSDSTAQLQEDEISSYPKSTGLSSWGRSTCEQCHSWRHGTKQGDDDVFLFSAVNKS